MKKYTMIVSCKPNTDEPTEYFVDRPWEADLSKIVYGDNADELMAGVTSNEFYQLYNNETGKRIGYGNISKTNISENIKFQISEIMKTEKFMSYLKTNKCFSVGQYEFSYEDGHAYLTDSLDDSPSYVFRSIVELENIIDTLCLNMRICDVCEMPAIAGYVNEERDAFYCSYPDFAKGMNEFYGKDNWREATKEEKQKYECDYMCRKNENKWEPEKSFFCNLAEQS